MYIKELTAQELTAQYDTSYITLDKYDGSINWVFMPLNKGYGKSPIWIGFGNGSRDFGNVYYTKTELSENLKKFHSYGSKVFAVTLPWGESIHFSIVDEKKLTSELQAKSLSGKRTTVARKPVRKVTSKRK